jgi:hypothetical protein
MKKTEIVNWLRHFKLIDVMNMIDDESMIVCFEDIIQWFYDLEYAVRVNIEMLDQFSRRTNEEIAIQWRDWYYVCLSDISEIQIHFRKDDDETYDQTLIDSLNSRWLSQYKILVLIVECLHYESWFLKRFVNIEMLNFVYESKVEYANICWYVALIDWLKNIFFDEFVDLSFCLNATNWESAMCTIESSLKATAKANNEIEAKTKSTIALNTKLRNAVDARYFRSRSRSRLDKFEKISDFDFWSFETAS